MRKFKILALLSLLGAMFLPLCSCKKEGGSHHKDELPKDVMIIYAGGFNNLSEDIEKNLADLEKGFIPKKDGNVLIVCYKLPKNKGDYTTQVAPQLLRYYLGKNGKLVKESLMTFADEENLSAPATLSKVLDYVFNAFPGNNYGLVVSGHATGWLPIGYFSNPARYDATIPSAARTFSLKPSGGDPSIVPFTEPQNWSYPLTKSIFNDHITSNSVQEMEIGDFTAAIPMHLDYLLFDACLMGSVEVAYALMDKCDVIGASPSEVLAAGFDYTKMAASLIGGTEPDPQRVCSDYYLYYSRQEGQYCSATIALVRTSPLERLAQVCKGIIDRHREGLAALRLNGSLSAAAQPYFYSRSRHWHYDLRDVLSKGGASEAELAEFDAVMTDCIVYKNATPEFLGTPIRFFSGLSTYLPSDGSKYLDLKYRDIPWNRAVEFVK